jgi:hypothetical protein
LLYPPVALGGELSSKMGSIAARCDGARQKQGLSTARLEVIKKTAQPWRVSVALYAYAHESAQKRRRKTPKPNQSNLRKKPCKLNNQ